MCLQQADLTIEGYGIFPGRMLSVKEEGAVASLLMDGLRKLEVIPELLIANAEALKT